MGTLGSGVTEDVAILDPSVNNSTLRPVDDRSVGRDMIHKAEMIDSTSAGDQASCSI